MLALGCFIGALLGFLEPMLFYKFLVKHNANDESDDFDDN